MPPKKPRVTAQIAGRALHPLVRPMAVNAFLAAAAADLVYLQMSVFVAHGVPRYVALTEWLLAAGLVLAVLAVTGAVVDLLGEPRFRRLPELGLYLAGSALAIALGLYNLELRQAAGAAAIAPSGAILSLATGLVLVATPWRGWDALYR